MKDKTMLVGGGGHCKSVIDVIECGGLYQIAGIVDLHDKLGSSLLRYKIFATDNDLTHLARDFREHDVGIDHCPIAPLSVVNGDCVVETDCFVVSNAVIIPGKTIKRNSLIAAGSVVISNVEENLLYAGNPARLKKKTNG